MVLGWICLPPPPTPPPHLRSRSLVEDHVKPLNLKCVLICAPTYSSPFHPMSVCVESCHNLKQTRLVIGQYWSMGDSETTFRVAQWAQTANPMGYVSRSKGTWYINSRVYKDWLHFRTEGMRRCRLGRHAEFEP